MSEIDRLEAFKQAVEFVRQQDKVVQAWIARLILIQTGLMAAIGALWELNMIRPLGVLLSLLAMVLVRGMMRIVRREYEWQKRYVEMVKRCEGSEPYLYQHNVELPGPSIDVILHRMHVLFIVGWALFILIVLAH
jgi:hypothetical protein